MQTSLVDLFTHLRNAQASFRRAKGLSSAVAATVVALAFTSAGATQVTLDTGGTGPFSGLVAGFQDIVNFLSGPLVTIVMTMGLIGAVITWFFVPKEGILQNAMRFVIGGITIMNIPGWITYIQSWAT